MLRSSTVSLHNKSGFKAWRAKGNELLLLGAYAFGFAFAHWVATPWSGDGFFSLWFPAAGLRLALLWQCGARLTLPIAMIEVGVDALKGIPSYASPDWPLILVSIVRPVLAYGLAVWMITRATSGSRATVLVPPMPFGLAAIGAPVLAALAALPQALIWPDLTGVEGTREIVTSLTAFAVGDLLGTLIVAPPLLWLSDAWSRGLASSRPKLHLRVAGETLAVLFCTVAVSTYLEGLGLGAQPVPVLLGMAWIGLRFGRAVAWTAIAVVVALTLPGTLETSDMLASLRTHFNLASTAVVGYLAGSFRDAQQRARVDVHRRDRLLFQAERLKTLRAMSVAVIHEISQPLATLAIEAKHLHAITADAAPEIADAAQLIHRKAAALTDLIRRLRRFGDRSIDEPAAISVAALVGGAVDLAAAHAKEVGVELPLPLIDRVPRVLAHEIELTQALLNLLHNAIHAAGSAPVVLDVRMDGGVACIRVRNRPSAAPPARAGMGVGSLVARAIVEAHGGSIERNCRAGGVVEVALSLPLLQEAH